ncbi:Ldh family oxidoreductase [Oceanobacillus jeddahense]|uniref:Ldh family oxidoreductase n=1 Tax=Oceanobacillus jeddahense TaxID=1462527 RepID=UPI0016528DB9|nr:Ldh family oxidoreductase [Oceanobacillus jeddahense]
MTKQTIAYERLEKFAEDVFLKVGLGEADAWQIANHLVSANLRGVDSHGVTRIPLYAERLLNKNISMGSEVELLNDAPSYAWVDGKNKHGILVAQQSMELAVKKAKESGIAVVGVKNSNHFGMLAYYGKHAIQHDCIAVITSNASPSMPPWGGKERFFGTSPICYAIPGGEEISIIGDMATSVVARGKIRLAAANNEKIPSGWAINKEGKSTVNPDEVLDGGMVLPMAGPKGYSLVVFIETLSSILTGAAFGPYVGGITDPKEQNIGHFFLVMRADIFQSLNNFKASMDQMIREIKNVEKMEGIEEIFLPGELEMKMEEKRKKEGVPLSEEVYNHLIQFGEKIKANTELIRK